jgi:CheY-like chemotaxis protein
MRFLSGMAVLLVQADDHPLDSLAETLERFGARVQRVSETDLSGVVALDESVDVIVADDRARQRDAASVLAWSRDQPRLRETPVIATQVDPGLPMVVRDAGIVKQLRRPTQDTDVALAIASCVIPRSKAALETEVRASFSLAPHLERHFQAGNVRAGLALLNSTATFRFTSAFRFDQERLTSVWTYDRSAPHADQFPLSMTVNASYCAKVRDGRGPFVVSDSRSDARVATHPKRLELLSYCGVPLYRADGSIYGSLCHFDAEARLVAQDAVRWLEQGAELMKPSLAD